MSTTIKVRCTDQVLAFENTPVITSGGQGSNVVQFSFCEKWAAHSRVAVFWREEAYAYQVVLDAYGSCPIPAEVLAEPGVFYFGVYGTSTADARRTSEVLSYPVAQGPVLDAIFPKEPTPDIYAQLLAQYAAVGPVITDTLQRVDTAEQQLAEFAQQGEDLAERLAAHADQHAAGGTDPITPEAIGAEPANDALTRYVDGVLLTGSGEEVDVGSDEFQLHTLWLVPYSYPDVQAFDTPDSESAILQTLNVDLPVAIDMDAYCYEFSLTVYGLQRYGDVATTAAATANVMVYLVDADGNIGTRTLLYPALLRTVAYEAATALDFPSGCTYYLRTMPVGGYTLWIQGKQSGETVTQYEGHSVRNGTLNTVSSGQYPQLRLQFQCGTSGAYPVQTFGIKFDYRAYMAKEG